MITNGIAIYYLAGPMAGIDDHNHPLFHEAAAQLRSKGYRIISPAEYGNLVDLGFVGALKRDIHVLLWCDVVIVLPGWEQSRGATMETNTAVDLIMPIYGLDIALANPIAPSAPPLSISRHYVKQSYYTVHMAGCLEIEVRPDPEGIFIRHRTAKPPSTKDAPHHVTQLNLAPEHVIHETAQDLIERHRQRGNHA